MGCRHSSVASSASSIPGSSPKHTIYAIIYNQIITKINKNEAGFGPHFLKRCKTLQFYGNFKWDSNHFGDESFH